MALPGNIGTGTVVARFGLDYLDGGDPDDEPDLIPAQGEVWFDAEVRYWPAGEAEGGPVTIIRTQKVGIIDNEGFLCNPLPTDPTKPSTKRFMKLFATDDPVLGVVGWRWTATPRLKNAAGQSIGDAISAAEFELKAGEILDLTHIFRKPTPGVSTPLVVAESTAAMAASAAQKAEIEAIDAKESAYRSEQLVIAANNRVGADDAQVAGHIQNGIATAPIFNARVTENVAQLLGWALVTDPKWAGGAKVDGSENASPAIIAALKSSAKTVYLPGGTFRLDSNIDVTAYSGKRLTGAGAATVLKFGPQITNAGLLGTSAGVTDLQLDNFVIDMQWQAGNTPRGGMQFTNAKRITIDRIGIRNVGGTAVLLQGLGLGGGTSDSAVTNCYIDGTGLADSSTGFGIWLKDASHSNTVQGNRIKGVKGGMGIGLGGTAGTGYACHNIITGNHITMAPSTIGFEAIGLTAGCNHNTISFNNTPQSYDNGYSISGNYNTVLGNVVGTCWNHGIGVAGTGNTIVGNNIRNVGRQDNLPYGGISIEGAWNTVADNFIFDDGEDGSPFRMSYKVKFVSSKGNNRVGPNQGYGQTIAEYTPLNQGRVPSDVVVTTTAGGQQFESLAITGAPGATRVLRFKTGELSRWAFVADATSENGSNSGSNLLLNAYDDAGTSIGAALIFSRANRTTASEKGFVQATLPRAPSDLDYATPPPDGTTVLDTTNHRLYIRSGGLWKFIALS